MMQPEPLTFNTSSVQLYQLVEQTLYRVPYLNRESPTAMNRVFSDPTEVVRSPHGTALPYSFWSNSSTDLYIKISGKYYPLLFVSNSIEAFNAFLTRNSNSGLIATDNNGYHYIAHLRASNQ